MSTTQRIAKNTSVLIVSQIITYVFGFFITIYAANYLGANGFGILSLALSITAIFGIISDMGLSTLLVREVARDKSLMNKYVSNTILMRIILSFIAWGMIILTVNIFNYPQVTVNVIYILTLSIVIGSINGVLSAVFQANEKMEYLSLSSIIGSVILFLGTLIGVYNNLDIYFFASIYLISGIITFIYLIIIYLWKYPFKFEIDLSFWKPSLKEAWPFGVTSLSGMLYTYIDSIMLSVLQGTEVVGWYSAAYKLMLITLFIPNAINGAIFPVMSKFYISSKDSLKLIYERYFKYMIIFAIPIGVGTTLLADKIILLIFKEGFTQSIIALQILIWTIVLTFAGAAFVQLLQSINKQLIITKISGICVIINILLNLVLIPKFSYIGASFATVITEIVLVGYIILACYKLGYSIDRRVALIDLSKVLLATLIMGAFVLYFRNSLNLFILVIAATIIYFISLYFVKGIDEEDKFLIKEILNRNN